MKDEILQFSAVGSFSDDESKWVEGTMSKTGDPWLEQPALLFYTGTHKGKPWTKGDLKKMDEQFTPPRGELDWSVPGQLDHSESARDTTGHLRKTWLEKGGDELWGTVRHVGAEAVQKAKNGLWRKLSLGVYGASRRIREYSITPFPHLTGATTFSETQTESEDITTMADDAKTPAAPKDEPTNFAEMKAQIEATFSERTSKLEARLEKSEKRNEELEGVVRFTQRAAEIDKFSDEGKTLPAMRETELKLVSTFSEDQMKLFREYKRATPALVDVDVHGSQDPEDVEAFNQGKKSGAGEDAEARKNRLAGYGRVKGSK